MPENKIVARPQDRVALAQHQRTVLKEGRAGPPAMSLASTQGAQRRALENRTQRAA